MTKLTKEHIDQIEMLYKQEDIRERFITRFPAKDERKSFRRTPPPLL